MSIVAEWHVLRSPAAAESEAGVSAEHLPVRIPHLHGAPDKIGAILHRENADWPRRYRVRRADGAVEMKGTSGTLENRVRDGSGIGPVNVDPWPATRIEHLRQCLDARCAVYAACSIPLHSYFGRLVLTSQLGPDAIRLVRLGWSASSAASGVRFVAIA